MQEWSAYFAELLGAEARVIVEEIPGSSRGSVADAEKRRAITGPARVGWREGFRRVAEQFYPDRLKSRDAHARVDRAAND